MRTDTTTGPVRWDGELGAYLVCGFDEASAVLRGSGWSSDPRLSPLACRELRELPPGGLMFLDPPDHTRLRNLLSPPFTPRAIERLRPRVTAIVDAVLDAAAEDDAGSVTDAVQEIGQLVPVAVISELLDVGTEGAELLQAQTPALFRLLEVNPTAEDLTESVTASIELMLFLTPLLAERRQHPGDDFISTLLAIKDIALEEVLATCMILLTAGHETTAAVISNGILAVLAQPDRRAQFLANPARATEELLRLAGPVKLVGRTALTHRELGGLPISAGQPVIVQIQEANRDPRRFPDPERLDLTREPAPQLAFGGGPHFCIGAALARLEATETLTRLFTRFPELSLTQDPIRRRPSTTFHTLAELPVHLRSRSKTTQGQE